MGQVTRHGEEIRRFVLKNVENHPSDISQLTNKQFGVSRQSIARHLKKLVDEGKLEASGNTRGRKYSLIEIPLVEFSLRVLPELAEDVVWRDRLLPLLEGIPQNVINICQFGFTEMFNNVISHSEAEKVTVRLFLRGNDIIIWVDDTGVGIFNKIKRDFNLNDPRHALLELAKGKITTDETHHTGEGVFFTSRMFDKYRILSDPLYYARSYEDDDWLLESGETESVQGTAVIMTIAKDSKRTTKGVLDEYTSGDGPDFSRTHVPLTLARYGEEQLISRSQARRVLARFDRFAEILLDFEGVDEIGRAFADEIFRVYRRDNPNVKIIPMGATPQIMNLIEDVIKQPEQQQLFTL